MREVTQGMTTRAVAEALGITPQAVRDRAKSLGKTFLPRQQALFTIEEVTAIKESIKQSPSNNLTESAKLQLCNSETGLEEDLQLAQAFQMLQNAQARLNAMLQQRLARTQEQKEKLEIQLDMHRQWASVKKVENTLEKNFSWQPLKEYSIENGYDVKKVFDQNYGAVNAYHADVWLAVYGVEL